MEGFATTRTIIEIQGLEKSYALPSGPLPVLRGIDLSISPGLLITITGPSGSGKSTLMNIIGLLDQYDSGTYRLDGMQTAQLSRRAKQEIRLNQIGFVFQTFNLIPTLTARENVELPLALLHRSQEDQKTKAREYLGLLDLAEKQDRMPRQLSIGEQQRVAIARALVNDPAVILADEPTGNLDEENARVVMDYMRTIVDAGKTVLVVSHNRAWAEFSDGLFRLKGGVLVQQ